MRLDVYSFSIHGKQGEAFSYMDVLNNSNAHTHSEHVGVIHRRIFSRSIHFPTIITLTTETVIGSESCQQINFSRNAEPSLCSLAVYILWKHFFDVITRSVISFIYQTNITYRSSVLLQKSYGPIDLQVIDDPSNEMEQNKRVQGKQVCDNSGETGQLQKVDTNSINSDGTRNARIITSLQKGNKTHESGPSQAPQTVRKGRLQKVGAEGCDLVWVLR